ncbi:MAG: deoxyribose-phosphate aldolase [Bacteroidales bacterium]|nr:deoxyribose-phosphate aldolase [Bacteroidales bacterium]
MIKFDKYEKTDNTLEKRITYITSKKFNYCTEKQAYKTILNCIDLTTLKGSNTEEDIIKLCEKAYSFNNDNKEIPNTAAVCVYPVFVKTAKNHLVNKNIEVASVAGCFPSGQSPLSVKMQEVQYAIDQGADEIDMVISRGKLIEKKYDEVFHEIKSIREICKDVHLKVILETGELNSVENIRKASELAINAGADFIKTSTGMIKPAATKRAVLIMADTIKEYYEKTGKIVGIKPAGGISEPEDAFNFLKIIYFVLGEKWINNKYFRIGASRLANNVLNKISSL